MILAFETSCDETSIALMSNNSQLIDQVLTSHAIKHKALGGVLPELQSRFHLIEIDKLLNQLLAKNNIKLQEVSHFCATTGPGLMGSLMIGVTYAKTLAYSFDKPFYAINHLVGHALSPRINDANSSGDNIPSYPYLILLLSGGNSLFAIVSSYNDIKIIGQTLDDSAGEAFDKTSNLLGFGYPGGAKVEKLAKLGNKDKYNLPIPLAKHQDCNLSFSGIKSAVRRIVETSNQSGNQNPNFSYDLCASFQDAITKMLCKKTKFAFDVYSKKHTNDLRFALVGGVAQNQAIRSALLDLAAKNSFDCYFAKPEYCSDNAAMIAQVCYETIKADGSASKYSHKIMPRWPLDNYEKTD